MKREKVVVIVGPTAVGKTKLSIEMAKALNGEIISGDSMQVYRGMDIGTAKATLEEREGIPHYLIDIREADEPFSAADFQQLVRAHIHDITNRGKLPIIVGGTGLYIQAALYDYQFSDTPGDHSYREELERLAEAAGIEVVYEKLRQADPKSAERIHPNNVRRVIRALEILHTTGKTMSEALEQQEQVLLYDVAMIGLTMEREKLYNRINKRVDIMLQQGLLEEVQQLHAKGIRDCQSVQAIGYKELYAYFDGTATLEEAVAALKTNSRRYAKRQLTWFRNKMNVAWFDITMGEKTEEIFTYVAGNLQLQSNNK